MDQKQGIHVIDTRYLLDLSTNLQEKFMDISWKVHIVCSSSHAGDAFSLWFTWLIEVASNRGLIFLLHF